MKKIVLILSVFALLLSCTDDITYLNTDTKNATEVPGNSLFTNAQKSLCDQMISTSVNLNVYRLFVQQWTETTYTDESNYDLVTRTIPDNHFQAIYRDVLIDLQRSKIVLAQEVFVGTPQEIIDQNIARENKYAIIDILTAYSYAALVDTFGNVPYSEAINLEDYPTPSYDDAETIYKDIIAKLTASDAALDDSQGSFGKADLIYGGDAAKWKKFANSLRLRLAINMADVDPTYASAQALAAVESGVITSNIDNANIRYTTTQPNTNPIYVDVVASGRDDFVPTSTIIDQMNTLNDPRRSSYFTLYNVYDNDGNLVSSEYKGGTPGASNNFNNFSHIGSRLLEPTFEGTLMDAAEVSFLLAEAVERGISVGGTAESNYDDAINASLTYWGVSAEDASTYLAQSSVAYSTATGTWQQKIGEQAYIALYNRGFEAWTSYRRLNFPVLIAPEDAAIDEVPSRYTYPAEEQTLNAASYAEAAAAIGGDEMTTHIFWDVD